MNDSNIKRLANLYATHQLRTDWTGPANEGALRAYIAGQDPGRMKRIGIDPANIDRLLISERDKQPFRIRWGLRSQARGPSLPVVFESAGVDGRYQVAFTGGEVMEVDLTEYEAMWEGLWDPRPEAERGEDGSGDGIRGSGG